MHVASGVVQTFCEREVGEQSCRWQNAYLILDSHKQQGKENMLSGMQSKSHIKWLTSAVLYNLVGVAFLYLRFAFSSKAKGSNCTGIHTWVRQPLAPHN